MPPWLAKKLVAPEALSEKVALLRREGKRIATLNGSFDLFHAGHLFILYEAAKVADVLLVALNSDESIRSYKGENRPIVPLNYRLELMAAIECVDFVTWFSEPDPCALLEKVRPDVHVNGVEYGANCIEAETVQRHGGALHLVARIPSLSTSALIDRIGKLCV
ncbi:MAG: adenylyltransferase/cytidyltransferase family protein [Verrucomicrobiota bacterium]|nr:adenylyltransferase/cytidyltransferase family protein [Verrucomicrobiota bacterium]